MYVPNYLQIKLIGILSTSKSEMAIVNMNLVYD